MKSLIVFLICGFLFCIAASPVFGQTRTNRALDIPVGSTIDGVDNIALYMENLGKYCGAFRHANSTVYPITNKAALQNPWSSGQEKMQITLT